MSFLREYNVILISKEKEGEPPACEMQIGRYNDRIRIFWIWWIHSSS